MTPHNTRRGSARTAKAAAISRAHGTTTALTTLILSVLVGLLSGAVWMHAT